MNLKVRKIKNWLKRNEYIASWIEAMFLIINLIPLSYITAFFVTRPNILTTVILKPSYSASGQEIDYTIEVWNDWNSVSSINEVRIYKNENYSYFECNERIGWELFYLPEQEFCMYITKNSDYFINPGEYKTFNFKAATPQNGCEMQWKFEMRFINRMWFYFYATTTLDTCQIS